MQDRTIIDIVSSHHEPHNVPPCVIKLTHLFYILQAPDSPIIFISSFCLDSFSQTIFLTVIATVNTQLKLSRIGIIPEITSEIIPWVEAFPLHEEEQSTTGTRTYLGMSRKCSTGRKTSANTRPWEPCLWAEFSLIMHNWNIKMGIDLHLGNFIDD